MSPGTPPQKVATAQKVIARSVGSNAFSFVIRFAARASLLYIGARLFGAATYGVFSLAVAVLELAAPMASLGLKRMIFPWLEEEAQSARGGQRAATHVLLDALLLVAVSGSLVAALIAGMASILPQAMASGQLRFALFALAPMLLVQVIGDIALAATRWTHKMRYDVLARGVIEPYVATAATLAAWYAGLRETGMLVGYWAGSIVMALFALWSARHCLGALHLRRWRPHPRALAHRVRSLLPASGSDVLTSLAQRIDLYLVGFLLGDAPAGVYAVLRQLRTPILQVRQAFDGILTPLIARTMRADGDVTTGEATAAATRLILTIQLGVVLLMASAGEALLGLFGQQYISGYTALLAMVLAEAVNGAFGVSELILYFRRPSLALAINVVLIGVAGALVPVFAPRLGIVGASGSMLLAAVIAAMLRRHWLKHFGVTRTPLHAAPPVVAALISAIAGLALSEVLVQAFAAPAIASQLAPPVLALALYGLSIWGWVRLRPGVLSLARFRVS